MASSTISAQGILARFVAALAMVFATYNPSGYSYYDWVNDALPAFSVPMIFLGVVLLIVWTVFIRATLRSLGALGLVLAAAFFGTLLWMVIDWGWIPADNVTAVTWIVLVALSGVLAVGMSWSHIRRRLSGQADMDDVDE